ncbi:hypothetical protein LAZ67_6000007 [Cordylochernes scorpioides]|uniref:C2H2-type domain-containing protein n=1 Tax=Cordylochernes scorpioides TaxID=51811 RepID=A0ABY6KJ43_9ARAC|nr:hypothetical protein LAZ67_6000007 [Cordylochernes scorpioides]
MSCVQVAAMMDEPTIIEPAYIIIKSEELMPNFQYHEVTEEIIPDIGEQTPLVADFYIKEEIGHHEGLIINESPFSKNVRKAFFKDERPFACNMCNYRAPSRGILEGHRRTHTGEKPFKCDQCNYRARMNGDLIKHMRIHQDEKPYQCEFCEFSTKHRGALRIHRRIHTQEKPYSCDQCAFRCSSVAALKKHQASHFANRVRKHSCTECGFSTATKSAMASHTRSHGAGTKKICPICEVAVSTDAFYLHMDNHSNEAFRCDLCTFRTKREKVFVAHILKHQKMMRGEHCCDKCDFATNDPLKLTTHKHIHEGESLYRCPHCPYTAPKKSNYQRHLYQHTGEKPYSCQYCDYSCRDRAVLNDHIIMRHPEKEIFHCSIPGCKYRTSFERCFKLHLGSHEGKTEQCPHCNHSFKRKADLNKHLKRHLADKEYKCSLCTFSTSTQGALTKHAADHAVTGTTYNATIIKL